MALFFWKREQEIEELMDRYLAEVRDCLDMFHQCLLTMYDDSAGAQAKTLVEQVDHAESRADEYRRKIESALYEKALMPDSRGDLMELVEMVDRIPNLAEELAYDVHLQRVAFPIEVLPQLTQLAEMNVQCVHLLQSEISALFTDLNAVQRFAKEVSNKEREIDQLEHQTIAAVFDLGGELAYKNLMHRMIRGICNISDKTENVSDRVVILAAKRRI